MSNKKHIDRLFQEKFKDFEMKPDSRVWENIQNEIAPKKEKKKRVIPIWFKYGGIAALLLLFFTVGITTFNSNSNPETVVGTETPIINTNIKNENLNKDKTTILNTPPVASSNNNNNIETNSNETKKDSKEDIIKKSTSNQTSVTVAATANKIRKTVASKNKQSTPVNTNSLNNTVATSTSSYKKPIKSSAYKKQNDVNLIEQQNNSTKTNALNGVAVISNSNVQKTANKEDNINNAINVVKDDTFSTTAISSPNVQKTANKEDHINNAINTVKDDTFSTTVTHMDSSNKNETTETLKDSVSTNTIENAIAKSKNESDKEKNKQKEEASSNKWTVNANVAPVYYNTIGKGSHIDKQFVDNEKTGAINTSYGINVGYAINDKLKIRSGVNSLNLGYNTDNVVIYESVANSGRAQTTLENLEVPNFSSNGIEISLVSGENINTNQLESFLVEEFKTTSLKQQINYIEIPVELEYALISKRFGVNVIGGLSTFILGDNDVSTELRGTTTQIGEVNNINDISFSTNIGLGIGFDFSKAFKINLEPTFKYQINAFNDTSGNFNPFIVGVYTGLSYKF